MQFPFNLTKIFPYVLKYIYVTAFNNNSIRETISYLSNIQKLALKAKLHPKIIFNVKTNPLSLVFILETSQLTQTHMTYQSCT